MAIHTHTWIFLIFKYIQTPKHYSSSLHFQNKTLPLQSPNISKHENPSILGNHTTYLQYNYNSATLLRTHNSITTLMQKKIYRYKNNLLMKNANRYYRKYSSNLLCSLNTHRNSTNMFLTTSPKYTHNYPAHYVYGNIPPCTLKCT